MASSALEWLESLDSPYQTRQLAEQVSGTNSSQQLNLMGYKNSGMDFDVSATVSFPSAPGWTKEQYDVPEIIPSGNREPNVFHYGRNFPPTEKSHRDQEVVPNGSQFPSEENSHRNPEAVLNGSQFPQKENSYRNPEVFPNVSQFWPKEKSHPNPEVASNGSQFWAKEKSLRNPEVVANGSQCFLNDKWNRQPEVISTGSKSAYYSTSHAKQEVKCPDKERTLRRNSVPDECKDARYWRKRSRNNMSAQKWRAAKRAKDTYIANKIDQLEKENAMLKVMLANVMMEQQQQQQSVFPWQ